MNDTQIHNTAHNYQTISQHPLNNVGMYKTLSPFTWSNLNIKLPHIHNKITNTPVISNHNHNNNNNNNRNSRNSRNNRNNSNGNVNNSNSNGNGSRNNRNNFTKLQGINVNKTIDISRSLHKQHKSQQIDRYTKGTLHAGHTTTNLDTYSYDSNQLHNPQPQRHERLKQYKRDLITSHLHKHISHDHNNSRINNSNSNNNTHNNINTINTINININNSNRQQSPKQRVQQMSTTSRHMGRLRSPISIASKASSISHAHVEMNTFKCNRMQTYIYKALAKCNWSQIPKDNTSTNLPQLVWTDHYMEHSKMNSQQLHNHISNAHVLTTKSSLHQMQSTIGSEHYPISYLMPIQYDNFCQHYEQNVVKICLKHIIHSTTHLYNIDLNLYNNNNKQLAQVLSEVTGGGNINEDTLMGVRLCLYLQQYRKCKNYRYFQSSHFYIPVQTRLQPSVLSSLLKACYQYWQTVVTNENSMHAHNYTPIHSSHFKIANMHNDIIGMLINYHIMLLKYQKQYKTLPSRNIWIVKPIASSRGAGISLLRNTQQFLTINKDRFEYSNKNKYNNKIIQLYIEQPMLLISPYPQHYWYRKFDIRQWVLVAYDKQAAHPLIYVFEDGYCRFSDMKFSYNYYRSEQTKIHITNYSVSDKTKNPQHSLMLLSELFSVKTQMKKAYDEQINKIVIETVMNATDIRFQQNRFELLGYDVMFDTHGKLWLLEINMNPACQTTRSAKLENIADRMVAHMIQIVKAASGKSIIHQSSIQQVGWRLVYGQQKFRLTNFDQIGYQPNIKPYYDVSLGKASFVEEVRRRSIIANAIQKIVTKYSLKHIWSSLANHNPKTGSNIDINNQEDQQHQEIPINPDINKVQQENTYNKQKDKEEQPQQK